MSEAEAISIKVPEDWDYNYLREYLLLLARKGRSGLESTKHFPKTLAVSKDWHLSMDLLRVASSTDMKERLTLIGFDPTQRDLHLPVISVTGSSDYLSPKIIAAEIQRAQEEAGVTIVIGDIHSHPRKLYKSRTKERGSEQYVLLPKFPDEIAFSAADLYRMIQLEQFLPVIGVVQGDSNLLAFKTRESKDNPVGSDVFNQTSFEKYWYETFGFKYLGSAKQFGAKRVVRVSPEANEWKMNLAIAEKHQLILYRGRSGQAFDRVFPS